MRIALFSTCIGDSLFPDAHKATAIILARLGHEVVFPEEQTCCGQMHINTGYQKQALGMIRTYNDAFADPSIDYVVAASGSCVGAVREQHVRLADRFGSSADVDGSKQASQKTLDLPEFLVDIAGVTNVGAFFPHKVTYHSSCHGLRFLKLADRPISFCGKLRESILLSLPMPKSAAVSAAPSPLKTLRLPRRWSLTRFATSKRPAQNTSPAVTPPA